MVTEKRQQECAQQAEMINEKMTQVEQVLQKMDQLEANRKQMRARAAIIADLLEPMPRSLVVATLTNYLPHGVSLVDCELKTKMVVDLVAQKRIEAEMAAQKGTACNTGKKQAPPTPMMEQTTLELKGEAGSDVLVAEFISNLNESPFLDKVDLIYSKEKTDGDLTTRSFHLVTAINPNARVSEDEVEVVRCRQTTKQAFSKGGWTLLTNPLGLGGAD